MKTITVFPVPPGTLVTVNCSPGYILSGNKVVTCEIDEQFEHSEHTPPACTIGTGRSDRILGEFN